MRGGVKNRKNIIKLAILGWFGILAVLFAMGASRWFGDITQSERRSCATAVEERASARGRIRFFMWQWPWKG